MKKVTATKAWKMIIDGDAPDNLSVDGTLDLRGTGITALPDNLSVGGSLYLRGTGITAIWTDDRGYELYPAPKSDGTIRWVAGCRFFQSTADALAHWGADNYPDPGRGAAFCKAIQRHEEAAQ